MERLVFCSALDGAVAEGCQEAVRDGAQADREDPLLLLEGQAQVRMLLQDLGPRPEEEGRGCADSALIQEPLAQWLLPSPVHRLRRGLPSEGVSAADVRGVVGVTVSR